MPTLRVCLFGKCFGSLGGHLFLFCNGQRNRLKVLVWDGSGLWVCAKRLEKGRFTWPRSGDAQGSVVQSRSKRLNNQATYAAACPSGEAFRYHRLRLVLVRSIPPNNKDSSS